MKEWIGEMYQATKGVNAEKLAVLMNGSKYPEGEYSEKLAENIIDFYYLDDRNDKTWYKSVSPYELMAIMGVPETIIQKWKI
jgi:hypothetical protein